MDPADAFDRFFDGAWEPPPVSAYGDGRLGGWVCDDDGQPAYEYTARTAANHWHLVGNDRIGATAHNGGYVQLYDWTRGGKCVNRWNPATRDYAGGFKFVQLGNQYFNTLFAYLPARATQRRLFGMGYFEKSTCCAGLTVVERFEAPRGDAPVLLSRTILENRRQEPVDVVIVEFWSANLHQLPVAPIVTHGLDRLFEGWRARFNKRFVMDAAWDGALGTVSIDHTLRKPTRAPKPEEPAYRDYHPKTIFLAALDPLPDGYAAYVTDGRLFFAEPGPSQVLPNAPPGLAGIADGRLISKRTAYRGNAVLAFRRTVRLQPGERATLRYLYGYAERSTIPGLVARYKQSAGESPVAKVDPRAVSHQEGPLHDIAPISPISRICQITHARSCPRALLDFAASEAPWLRRELQWHAYYLQAGSYYQDFYQAHFVDQGSAYAYLHGASGAPRDFALFTLPMVYLRSDLAKDMLRFMMCSQHHATGALPYAYLGHGKVSGAGVHGRSSDLDLFLLWALAEYLGATRDMAFLNEELPYYPPSRGCSGSVLDHLRSAFRHLTQVVGRGPHGLIRCGTGDWNDVLLAFSRMSPLTIRRGESSLNAGLATVALPALAGAIEVQEPAFAKELRAYAAIQAEALRPMWTGEWVARGYLGYGDAMLGKDRLFLDTQAFGVLGGVWNDEQRRRLFENINRFCVEPQPAGALCLWPPMRGPFLEAGSDTNGGTWAAVDMWTAWAWAAVDPRAAWEFYLSTTLAARAEAYPDVWYNIWSGPDSYNAHYHPRPGETFNVNATAMTQYPVMNMNRHAGPLFDAIKLAGIGSRDGVIVIDPHLPFNTFAIRLPLMGAAYRFEGHRGYYVPVVSGVFEFAVRPPAGVEPSRASLMVDGHPSEFSVDPQGLVRFRTHGEAGTRITWELQ